MPSQTGWLQRLLATWQIRVYVADSKNLEWDSYINSKRQVSAYEATDSSYKRPSPVHFIEVRLHFVPRFLYALLSDNVQVYPYDNTIC